VARSCCGSCESCQFGGRYYAENRERKNNKKSQTNIELIIDIYKIYNNSKADERDTRVSQEREEDMDHSIKGGIENIVREDQECEIRGPM